jgi:hypothetical protein|nr:hypothetical protein [Leuconostoc mesenteroides]
MLSLIIKDYWPLKGEMHRRGGGRRTKVGSLAGAIAEIPVIDQLLAA